MIRQPSSSPASSPSSPSPALHATHDSRQRWLALCTIVLTLLGWSSIPLFLRHFSHSIDFWTANGWRYAFSAILWAPVILWAYARGTFPPGLWAAALLPSLFNCLGQVFFGLAPYLVQPGLMTFGLRVHIVFVTIGAALFFPAERALLRKPAFLLGIALVLLGTLATVALQESGLRREGDRPTLGVLVAIASGAFYAVYSLLVRRNMARFPSLLAFSVVSQLTAVGMVAPMLVFAHRHGSDALDLPARQFALLVLSSVIGVGLGHTLYFFSIKRLGVAVSAGVTQLQPVLVSIASIQLFDEHLTPAQWAFGFLAVAGAIWMLIVQHRHAKSLARA